MQTYCLIRSTFLPIGADVAWAFFTNTKNVPQLLPRWLSIEEDLGTARNSLHPGQVHVYRMRLLGMLCWPWVLKVTHVEAPTRFCEELKVGPFHFWHHACLIIPTQFGVDVEDTIHYTIAAGLFSSLLAFWIRLILERVLDHREQMLGDFFGET